MGAQMARDDIPRPTPVNAVEVLSRRLAAADSIAARIALIEQEISGRIVFSTSLSLEDQVILHAIAASGAKVDVFTLDSGRHFPETLETIAASESRYGIRIKVIAPDAVDLEQLVARDGINGFRTSVKARVACCGVRKVQPLRRTLAGASAWITGLRQGQSGERRAVTFATVDSEFNLLKFSPLADWSFAHLEAYVAQERIPINPLHALGFLSIGCQPCTRAVLPGEDIRAGRWWWEHAEGKECGLHRRPAGKAKAVTP